MSPTLLEENCKIIKDNLKWVELEKRPDDIADSHSDPDIYVPGSGIAKQLYKKWYVY